MNKLFLDIETLPCNDDMKSVYVSIMRKKNSARDKDKDDEQLFLESGFDGTFGRICCIAYIKEGTNGIEKEILRGTEEEILTKFWQIARDVHVFIGHNVLEFDLPFIYQRSMVKNIRPSQNINFAKYRNNPIYDTMKEWTKWAYNAGPKLDSLAKVLNLPTSKDAMDGSEVYTYFLKGKIDEICAYCMKDVVLTRQVYYKMNFEVASEVPGIEAFTTLPVKPAEQTPPVNTSEEQRKPESSTQPSLLDDTDEIPF